jgi:hypothetical protein
MPTAPTGGSTPNVSGSKSTHAANTNIPRITSMSEFNTRLLNFQSDYGIQLRCRLEYNVAGGNGTPDIANQWTGEVWYFDGPTRVATSAIGNLFQECVNALLANIALMLEQHGELTTTGTKTRKTA